LAREIKLELQPARKESRKRYIVRGLKPLRWPLSFKESSIMALKFLKSKGRRKPQAFETVAHWAERVLGKASSRWLLAPALQGIYAGNADEMSASLILGRLFEQRKKKKPSLKGTVSPKFGMGELISRLQTELELRGVKFIFESKLVELPLEKPVVVATSFWDAQELLAHTSPEASNTLLEIQSLPLVCVQAYYKRETRHPEGFGCLFPEQEGFQALGVLYDEDIFDNRTEFHAERWILGGAKNLDIMSHTDAGLIEMVNQDRRRLLGEVPKPLSVHITRWPKGLPHYTLALERALHKLKLDELQRQGIFLVGNYLGEIGLARILERAHLVAGEVQKSYG